MHERALRLLPFGQISRGSTRPSSTRIQDVRPTGKGFIKKSEKSGQAKQVRGNTLVPFRRLGPQRRECHRYGNARSNFKESMSGCHPDRFHVRNQQHDGEGNPCKTTSAPFQPQHRANRSQSKNARPENQHSRPGTTRQQRSRTCAKCRSHQPLLGYRHL